MITSFRSLATLASLAVSLCAVPAPAQVGTAASEDAVKKPIRLRIPIQGKCVDRL